MDYRVLGPVTVRRGGANVKLGGPRQRMVLAVLLSRAGRTIPQDRLIEEVWNGAPPETARATLQRYVYGLRQELGHEAILRRGDGYAVTIDDGVHLDAVEFEAVVAEGRAVLGDDPSSAREALVAGLELWTGTAYAGLEANAGLMAEADRLAELRLLAVESRLEADLALGRHAEVVGELDALVRDHPLRERFRRLQMLALYRSGRQAEALEAYHQARDHLADELGIDPSAELQELHRRILDHDPSLAAPVSARPVAGSPLPVVPEAGTSRRGIELRGVIGAGGRGVVHRGYQPSIGREVAVKVIPPAIANDPAFVLGFERDARALAGLEHPHVLSLIDCWRDPGGAYLVMPLLRGGSLAASLRHGPWSLSSALTLLDQVGGALAHAHRQGVRHGALTPENVLLDEEGNVYLTDFGLTATPARDDAAAPTCADDIVCLALLLVRVLTAMPLVSGRPLAPLADARHDLPEGLWEVLARATSPDPAQRHERVEALVRDIRQAVGADVVAVAGTPSAVAAEPVVNPYKGLRAFRESDAEHFHGREGLIEELLAAVSAQRVVSVVGPSGSGKSSVVHAGLLPALRADGIPGSRTWLTTDMFPGSYPFEELEAALLRVAVDRPDTLRSDLLDARGLLRVSKRILPHDDSTLLLVIDQFEELFSAVTSEERRQLFLDNLVAVATDERSRVRIVLTMRGDFFERPLQYPEFAEVFGASLITVGPPTRDGMTQAIAAPARTVGLMLEPGLVSRILADVGGQPGGLPLLQHALSELFARREGAMLTVEAYEATGGVVGALGRRAEELFAELSDAGRDAAQQMFVRLVTVDEHASDTRRRARRSELRGLDVDGEALDDVLRQYGRFRLLSFDRDPISRGPTVEVAHEALLTGWPRLAGWIDQQRQSLLLARRITVAARDWADGGRDDSDLLRGARLEQAEEFRAASKLALTEDEVAFLAASAQRRDRISSDAANRRRRVVLAFATALAVVASLAGFAELQRREAQQQARAALVRELASESLLAIEEDPERAILIAMAAVRESTAAGEPPLPEALGALQSATQATRLLSRHDTPGYSLAVGGDGTWFAVAGLGQTSSVHGAAVVVDAQAGTVLALDGDAPAASVAALPGGDVLVGYDTTADPDAPAVARLDARTGGVVRTFDAASDHYHWLDASPDGRHLAATSCERLQDGACLGQRAITVWSADSGQVVGTFAPTAIFGQALFLPENDALLIASHDPPGLGLYGLDGQERAFHDLPLDEPTIALHRSSGRVAVTGFSDSRGVRVYDVDTGRQLVEIPGNRARAVAWDESGAVLAISGNDGLVRVVDAGTGEDRLELSGSATSTIALAFLDSDRLLSGNHDQMLVWDLTPTGPAALGAVATQQGPQWGIHVSPSGERLAAFTQPGNSFELLDARTGDVQAALEDELVGLLVGIRTPTPDLSLVGSLATDGRSTIRRLPSLDVVAEFGECRSPAAISPDGRLAVVSGWTCSLDDPPPGAATHTDVIDLASGEVILELPHLWVYSAVFAPEGVFAPNRYLAITAQESVQLWDLEAGSLVAEMMPEDNGLLGHLVLAFDPEGRYLAAGSIEGFTWVVDTTRAVAGAIMADAVVFGQTTHTGPAAVPALGPDGVLATAGFDGLVRVWDVTTGDLQVEFRTDVSEQASVVAIAADGSEIRYPDANQVIRRYPTDPDALIALAEDVLTRDMTPDECRRHLGEGRCADL